MSTDIATRQQEAGLFLPVMDLQQAISRYDSILAFTKTIMKDGKDFGVFPGVDKPSLFKPGAEKLCSFFGLTPEFTIIREVETWTGEEPFFYYFYKCRLTRGGRVIGEGDGSCNSREVKYRYRWLSEDRLPAGTDKAGLVSRGGKQTLREFEFALERAETTGQYGKPAEYWERWRAAIAANQVRMVEKETKRGIAIAYEMEIDTTLYRMNNPEIADQVNTIQKISQKRSFIAATLIACNASEYYTQDIEDMDYIDAKFVVMPDAQRTEQPIDVKQLEKTEGTPVVIKEPVQQKPPVVVQTPTSARRATPSLLDSIDPVKPWKMRGQMIATFAKLSVVFKERGQDLEYIKFLDDAGVKKPDDFTEKEDAIGCFQKMWAYLHKQEGEKAA